MEPQGLQAAPAADTAFSQLLAHAALGGGSASNPYACLADAKEAAAGCTRCVLHQGRTHSVFADGNPEARLMLVGEGPGQTEDELGLPFVGKAGQLLNQILGAVGIDRQQDIYICNTVKCRPPQNRAPQPEEMTACRPYLWTQLALVRPRILLLAGASALKGVLGIPTGITKIRGQWLPTPPEAPFYGVEAMAIFHPSYLLRNASKAVGSPKWLMWQDIQEIRRRLDALEIPVHGQNLKT